MGGIRRWRVGREGRNGRWERRKRKRGPGERRERETGRNREESNEVEGEIMEEKDVKR